MEINSSSLFHFTKSLDILFKILSNGLRFSYCYESFGQEIGMAIPMICFCDIPLMRSKKHSLRYGQYAIGLDKKYLRSRTPSLSPVHYITSMTIILGRDLYKETIVEALQNEYNKTIEEALKQKNVSIYEFKEKGGAVFGEDIHYKLDSLTIAKVSYQNHLAYTRYYSERVGNEEVINYDEREWRIIPHQNPESDDLKWKKQISPQEFEDLKKVFAGEVENSTKKYITIPAKDIIKAVSFIAVKDENEVINIINYILKTTSVFGNEDINDDIKKQLISKITSFERINKDY